MRRIGMLLLAGCLLLALGVQAALPETAPEMMEITVEENETLWDIAVRHSDDTVDVREAVYQLREINHITDSTSLQPGQVLLVPAEIKN